MKKLWKRFDDLSGKCYSNMIGAYKDFEVWNEAFGILLDIVSEGREKDPEYAKELVYLDDSTDFGHDVCGWLEDYLDELDMREEHEKLLKVCEKLLSLFRWEEDSPSDLYFRISAALANQGKYKEALEFCEKWYQKDADNICAATALIYAGMGMKELDRAEELVEKYISDSTECTEENDIIFIAASALYKVNGNKKAEKRVNEAIQRYEKELEEFYSGMDGEDEFDFDMMDEDLPFN